MKHEPIRFHPGSPLFRQRGASLLEGIAYLGIASIVILGAVALLSSAFGSANINRGYAEVTSIRTGVKKLFMGQSGSYGSGNINATLVAAQIFPRSLAQSGTSTVTNGWNGAVTVTASSTANTFTITYANVPKDACVNMVAASTPDWTGLSVNSVAVTIPVTPSAANTACSSSTANTIAWESA